ncbi:hypothetical protein C0Q70_02207 [Pomacea canaliculata]|uniref:Uncharacterized protein n=1 Tax=Pomacea canaliculata TaxID=400727 RepID=A0A2T7Q1L7_POMCA|nr:hypothetical protein C0Q70_02207 [Pomacea canaliculata]
MPRVHIATKAQATAGCRPSSCERLTAPSLTQQQQQRRKQMMRKMHRQLLCLQHALRGRFHEFQTNARLPALGGQTFHNNGFTLGQLAVSTNKRNAAQGPSRRDFFFPQSTPLAAITARHNNDNRHHQVGRYANVVPGPTARTRAHVHARTSLLQPHLDGEAIPACFTHARTPCAGIIDRVAKSFHARTAAPSSTYIIIITAPRGFSCTLALSLADRPASVHGLSHTDSTFLNTGVSPYGGGMGRREAYGF